MDQRKNIHRHIFICDRLKTTFFTSIIAICLGYSVLWYNNDLSQSIVAKQEPCTNGTRSTEVKQQTYIKGNQSISSKPYTNGTQSIEVKQQTYIKGNQSISSKPYTNGTQSIEVKQQTYIKGNQSISLKPYNDGTQSAVKQQTYIKGNQSISLMLQPHEGMSACLVVREETTLPEWLAYHYVVGPLRYLEVAIDPYSKTSPIEILRKWNTTTDMEILVVDGIPRGNDIMNDYRRWQVDFYKNCICHHWENNRTWMLNTDVDEYIAFNPLKKTRLITKYSELRKKLPRDLGSKTVLQVIEEEKENYPWAFKRCIYMPRVTFGDMDEQNRTILYEGIPKGFDPKKFNTLRFFRHDYLTEVFHFAIGKSLFDVSRFKKKDFSAFSMSGQHFPHEECVDSTARRNGMAPNLSRSVFKVNHYSGTKAAYNKRGKFDSKDFHSWKIESMSKANRFVNYQTKSWLLNFVKQEGFAKAKDLLEGTSVM